MKERIMQSAETNNVTNGRVNISHAGPRFWSTKMLAATVRSAMTLAVLSVLLLIAARPAQAQTEAVLYNFNGNPDGANPQSRLTLNGGNLYGTTQSGGLGSGTVFELSPNGSGGWNESVLYNFCSLASCADGANPTYAYVTFDGQGNLYGTAYAGGANGYGVVYKLSPGQSGWTETVLYSFASSPDGANPVNGLIMDAAGKLYGTTYAGGQGSNGGNGTIFQLTPSGGGWTEKVIANIRSTYSGLTMDGAGNIFGTTYTKVFKLSPNGSGWKWTVLYTFGAGSNPNGTVVLDSAGNLYGTTFAGGTYGNVYKLTPGNGGPWTKTILYAFSASSPNHPLAGVVFDSAGNLYGTTTQGGIHNDGNVFELVSLGKGKYKFKVLQAFAGENGFQPFGSLILDSAGYVYGTTTLGGSSGNGIVFEVNANAIMTTCTLTSSPNPSNQGDTVTFTATVTPAPPDGELITFEAIAQAPLVGGQAVFTTSALPVGYTRVRAIYFGDFNFYQSRSAWVYQHVK
jgi:uncharacterized repeat protein (TIGR03803 family)